MWEEGDVLGPTAPESASLTSPGVFGGGGLEPYDITGNGACLQCFLTHVLSTCFQKVDFEQGVLL